VWGRFFGVFNNHQVWVFEKIRIKEQSVPGIYIYIYIGIIESLIPVISNPSMNHPVS
jgi:hypothetical protein